MTNRMFFIQGDDGEEYGPADLLELREWVVENRVGLGTRVRENTAEATWRAWQDYPELIALLAQVQSMRQAPVPPDLVGLEFAPRWSRAASWFMDALFTLLLFLPIWIVLLFFLPPELLQKIVAANYSNFNEQSSAELIGILQILFYFLQLFYFTSYLSFYGATPAKRLLNIRVVDEKGRTPSFYQALIRTVALLLSVHAAFCLPVLYAFFQPQRRTLHDLIAGTYVVRGSA